MREKAIVLERSIQNDLKAIAEIYEAIGTSSITAATSETDLIVLAYRLHNLYNAFENIFQQIAITFENSLDDPARWHAQLLHRMQLDLMPMRPAVIDADAYEKLDELRRFRHLFRSAYRVKLDARRLQLVLEKTLELRTIYAQQIETFLRFLRSLQ